MTQLLTDAPPTTGVPPFPAGAAAVQAIVRLALAEDIGRGDITTEATVVPGTTVVAEIVQKAPGVVCGLPVVEAVYAELDPHVRVKRVAHEGSAGERRVVAHIEGPAQAILTGERTALNFLQRLSAVASASARAARIVSGTRARVVDTRKTTPGMRVLEKYAVRVGGAANHRSGLDDGFLIKENHIRAAGGLGTAVQSAARRAAPGQVVEVEVTTLDELDQALAAGAHLILLDNFPLERMRAAVRQTGGRARLEASGGITLDNLAEVAATGVDLISLGALTHSAGAIDFSMEVRG
jgi:nicotinate-nucleotide pyrophosphorylase (carboxylating)